MCRNVRSIEWHQKTYHEISWDYPFNVKRRPMYSYVLGWYIQLHSRGFVKGPRCGIFLKYLFTCESAGFATAMMLRRPVKTCCWFWRHNKTLIVQKWLKLNSQPVNVQNVKIVKFICCILNGPIKFAGKGNVPYTSTLQFNKLPNFRCIIYKYDSVFDFLMFFF
jgi:hypothetical protein